jgi:hypothetical protein
MDYLTRRSCVIAYAMRSSTIFGGAGMLTPHLSACGPRVLFSRATWHPTSSSGVPVDGLFVPLREVTTAFDDLGLTNRVGTLPSPVAAQYPSGKLDLLDARDVEKLLENTGYSVDQLKKLAADFFESLRSPASPPGPMPES